MRDDGQSTPDGVPHGWGWDERLGFWWRWQRYVLERKGITGDAALRAAIRHDLVVALAAARAQLDTIATNALLDEFFTGRAELGQRVIAAADENVVNHLGFQIREPLDVWLEGLAHWAPRLGLEVVGTKRFPASEAFRGSVGAFVEMAQVWVRQEGVTVELELFDIHRPNVVRSGQAELADGWTSTQALLDGAVPDVLRAALADDDIWHYGVRIADERAIDQLHERFLQLVRVDERFRLRTEHPVANPWHGSVHTKLTNVELDTEIEFLTYRVDWQARESR